MDGSKSGVGVVEDADLQLTSLLSSLVVAVERGSTVRNKPRTSLPDLLPSYNGCRIKRGRTSGIRRSKSSCEPRCRPTTLAQVEEHPACGCVQKPSLSLKKDSCMQTSPIDGVVDSLPHIDSDDSEEDSGREWPDAMPLPSYPPPPPPSDNSSVFNCNNHFKHNRNLTWNASSPPHVLGNLSKPVKSCETGTSMEPVKSPVSCQIETTLVSASVGCQMDSDMSDTANNSLVKSEDSSSRIDVKDASQSSQTSQGKS